MNKRTALIIGLFIFGLMLAWFWSSASDSWVYRTQFQQSDQLIKKVEQFERVNNRLPTEAESVEFKAQLRLPADEQCPCYMLEEENEFIVWFGYQTTGSSMVYNSRTAEWAPRH